MTRPRSAPMPTSLRANRPAPHPARTVRCPHCGAAEGTRCTTRSGRITKTSPCPARRAAHAIATAVCPTCQTAPGTPCRGIDGTETAVHQQRYTEAEGDAA
ncbi:hypothetical protein [Streptomyces sp. NPDC059538]|uniref:zinc finger domain-containing protein n=1 Tax=Streptomyces sp. NPDC059538 TaxID=3346860 RepID=UPI0036835E73